MSSIDTEVLAEFFVTNDGAPPAGRRPPLAASPGERQAAARQLLAWLQQGEYQRVLDYLGPESWRLVDDIGWERDLIGEYQLSDEEGDAREREKETLLAALRETYPRGSIRNLTERYGGLWVEVGPAGGMFMPEFIWFLLDRTLGAARVRAHAYYSATGEEVWYMTPDYHDDPEAIAWPHPTAEEAEAAGRTVGQERTAEAIAAYEAEGGPAWFREIFEELGTPQLREERGDQLMAALAARPAQEAVPALLALLQAGLAPYSNPSPGQALALLAAPGALAPLLRIAADEGADTEVRAQALRALEAYPEAAVTALLQTLLAEEQNELLLMDLPRQLAPRADEAMKSVWLDRLERGDWSGRRLAALVDLLGRSGSSAAYPRIHAMLLDPQTEAVVRHQSATAVGRLGGPDTAPLLLGYLAHPDQTLGVYAARALEAWDDPALIPQILAHLGNAPDETLRYALGAGWSGKPRPAVVTALTPYLEAADAATVSRMLEFLAGALKPIAEAGIEPPDPQGVAAALGRTAERFPADQTLLGRVCGCLGHLPIPAARDLLVRLIKGAGQRYPEVLTRAVRALGCQGALGLPALLQLLEEGWEAAGAEPTLSGELRAVVVETLGRINSPEALPALFAAMDRDPSPAVRVEATSALARLDDPRVVPRLHRVLERGEPGTWVAAQALVQRKDPDALAPLVAALPHAVHRAAVAIALAQLADPRAVDPLLACWEAAMAETAETIHTTDYLLALAGFDDPRSNAMLAKAAKESTLPKWIAKAVRRARKHVGWSAHWRRRGVPE